MKKFLRRTWNRYSKLGKRRKKKQVWRSPKGRDNKMREKRRGYPKVVSIGYRASKETRGKIREKIPFIVNNLKDFEKIKKDNIVIIGNVGKKKKIEIAKKARKEGIEVFLGKEKKNESK
jgi:large subunit ribosomal protein L32e